MTLEIEIKNGFILPQKTSLRDGIYVAKVNNQDLRTKAQNSAMHLYFTHLANELNGAGYSFTKVISDPELYKAEIEWSPLLVKEKLWKPIQEALYNKRSTTQLTKEDITRVYDNVNNYTSKRLKLGVPFPHYEIKEK